MGHPQLRIKAGASIEGLKFQGVVIIAVAYDAFSDLGVDTVITSGTEPDAPHMARSKHWTGEALDFRTRHIDKGMLGCIKNKLQLVLGDDYDVIIEPTHLHVEYDPKQKTLT